MPRRICVGRIRGGGPQKADVVDWPGRWRNSNSALLALPAPERYRMPFPQGKEVEGALTEAGQDGIAAQPSPA